MVYKTRVCEVTSTSRPSGGKAIIIAIPLRLLFILPHIPPVAYHKCAVTPPLPPHHPSPLPPLPLHIPGPHQARPLLCRSHLGPERPQLRNTLPLNHPKYSKPRFLPSVRHLLQTALPPLYQSSLRSLHAGAVAKAMSSLGVNLLLQSPPAKISSSEESLHRPYRTNLSQLRTGFYSSLQEYRHEIGLSDSAACPQCSVLHLFSCPVRPTTLTVLDSWERPVEECPHLATLTSPPPPPPPLYRTPPQLPPSPGT